MPGPPSDPGEAPLSQTEEALGGPITAITPSAARSLLGHWQSECAAAETDLDLRDVGTGLGALQALLDADTLDGRAIGRALRALGASTAALAAQASDEPLAPRLERIAALLARAATALGS